MQHKTIESVLERGEKLDSLVDRSNALSAQSKMFYKTAKKVVPPPTLCRKDAQLTLLPFAAKLVLRGHVECPCVGQLACSPPYDVLYAHGPLLAQLRLLASFYLAY